MAESELPSVNEIERRLTEVRSRIEGAGGSLDDITVVAVTKTFPAELARRAVEAGLHHLGENYAQELESKAGELSGSQPRWHFIGGLQSNKIKRLAGTVSLWESIDRTSLIDELAKRDPGARLLIQVNTTGEWAKSGCEPTDTERLVDLANESGLSVAGLMTVGPTSGDPRPAFDLLADLGRRLGLSELSMGMSGDFELAVARGATIVRLGSVLFGPRRVETG